MAVDPTSRHSRRSLLVGAAGAAGAIGATAALSIAGPLQADAATDQQTYTNDETSADVFTAQSKVQAGFSQSGEGNAVTGISDSGFGVIGKSNSWIGVQGQSESNCGVFGTSNSDVGVLGQGATVGVHGDGGGSGVSGESSGGSGVFGTSGSGIGVRGTSTSGRGGVFSGGAAQVRLSPSTAGSHPVSGQRGDLFVDASGRLWFCKGGRTWKQIA